MCIRDSPKGYELLVVGDLVIRDGYVYVPVRKITTQIVKLNFYDEDQDKQIAEVEMKVSADATYVNTGDMTVPEGYELVVVGDLAIRDGYVYVQVRKITSQTVRLNFYDEDQEKQIAEVEMEVSADATYVNTGDMIVPEGYELVVVGDLVIRDG